MENACTPCDNHKHMHKYTDHLISSEETIRSKENPIEGRKQNRRDLFRGTCGFMLISGSRMCVRAIQRLWKPFTKGKRWRGSAFTFEGIIPTVSICMILLPERKQHTLFDQWFHFPSKDVSQSENWTELNQNQLSFNLTNVYLETKVNQTAVHTSQHETALTCRDTKTKICSSLNHTNSFISSFSGEVTGWKRKGKCIWWPVPNCLTSGFIR